MIILNLENKVSYFTPDNVMEAEDEEQSEDDEEDSIPVSPKKKKT